MLFVATFILLIFGILGVQLFAGRFASCSRGEHLDKAACEAVGGLWANPAFGNFDDIAAAALLLFEMAGMEGWPDVMYQGIDAVGVDEAPVRDASVSSGLFFVLWIVVGGMFVLNLFVGVIVDTYTDVKEEDEGTKTMTDDQRQWRQIMAQSLSIQPVRRMRPPTNTCRKAAHALVEHAD